MVLLSETLRPTCPSIPTKKAPAEARANKSILGRNNYCMSVPVTKSLRPPTTLKTLAVEAKSDIGQPEFTRTLTLRRAWRHFHL